VDKETILPYDGSAQF